MKTNGVIWITGFSAAGKTSLARKVENLLRKKEISTVSLDGDDLRNILGADHSLFHYMYHYTVKLYIII